MPAVMLRGLKHKDEEIHGPGFLALAEQLLSNINEVYLSENRFIFDRPRAKNKLARFFLRHGVGLILYISTKTALWDRPGIMVDRTLVRTPARPKQPALLST